MASCGEQQQPAGGGGPQEELAAARKRAQPTGLSLLRGGGHHTSVPWVGECRSKEISKKTKERIILASSSCSLPTSHPCLLSCHSTLQTCRKQ